MALATGAVVVPVALLGTERVQPIGARFPRVHRVTVRYGAPLDFAALSHQEYVDRYHERPAA